MGPGGRFAWLAHDDATSKTPSFPRHQDSDTYLEDHPVTKRKWLITMVIISPQDLWLWDLFLNGRTPWLFQWGLHPNYLRVMGSHPPSIAKQRFLGLNESDFVEFFLPSQVGFSEKKTHVFLVERSKLEWDNKKRWTHWNRGPASSHFESGPTLPETNIGSDKWMVGKTSFLLGRPIFRGYV